MIEEDHGKEEIKIEMAEETNLKHGSIAIKSKLMRGATGVSNGKQRESDYF